MKIPSYDDLVVIKLQAITNFYVLNLQRWKEVKMPTVKPCFNFIF
jgi:hypothetical protein